MIPNEIRRLTEKRLAELRAQVTELERFLRVKPTKRRMSKAARAKIGAAQRARWAKLKKGK